MQGPEFGEWLEASGLLAGEQLQVKAAAGAGAEVLVRRGPAPSGEVGGQQRLLACPSVVSALLWLGGLQ